MDRAELTGALFGVAPAPPKGCCAHWRMEDGNMLHVVANLSDAAARPGPDEWTGTILWHGGLSDTLSPWLVHGRLGDT
jgi:hypothetical protein